MFLKLLIVTPMINLWFYKNLLRTIRVHINICFYGFRGRKQLKVFYSINDLFLTVGKYHLGLIVIQRFTDKIIINVKLVFNGLPKTAFTPPLFFVFRFSFFVFLYDSTLLSYPHQYLI